MAVRDTKSDLHARYHAIDDLAGIFDMPLEDARDRKQSSPEIIAGIVQNESGSVLDLGEGSPFKPRRTPFAS
jgi:hypothetical protein